MAGEGRRILTQLGVRMVLVTLVAGVAAALFAVRLDNSYRARVLLILAPMPLEQKDEVPGLVATNADPARRVSFVQSEILKPLPMPDYKLLLTSEAIAEKLRDFLRDRYVQAGIDPGNLTVEKVKRSLDIRSKVHIQTQLEVQYQQVVELLFTAADPRIAAEVCNEWARLGIQMAEEMRLIAREGAVDFFQQHLDDSKSQLVEQEKNVEKLDAGFNAGIMKTRLEDLESTVTARQVRRSQINSDIARLEAEVAQLTADLPNTPPTLTLKKASSNPSDAPVNLEEANPVYTALTERRMLAAGELAGMRAENTALEQEIVQLEASTNTLRADLARVTREKAEFEQQIEILKKRVDELSMTLQSVQLSAANTEPAFKIASPASPPEEKVAPQRSLIVLVTVFLAGVAVPVHLFGMQALRRYAKSLDVEEANP